MKMSEKFTTAEVGEQEHFDDFGAMDIALRGLARVLADKPKPDTVSGEEDEVGVPEDEGDYGNDENDEDYYDEESYDWEEENYGTERTEELEREKQFELFTIPKELLEEYQLPKDLSSGVSIMGGTARSLARRLITGDYEPVRDLDLVFIPELTDPDSSPTDEELEALSAKYMPDDYAYGYGIKSENLEKYFETRDFTINQCLVAGDKLLVTRAAYDDFQENIIRPSYDLQSRDNQPMRLRHFMKALLLQTVFNECCSSYATLEDCCIWGIGEVVEENTEAGEDIRLDYFNIALTLNKAMSRGARTAMHFTENLVEWDVVSEKFIDQPMKLARALRSGANFVYRPLDKMKVLDDKLEDSMFAELESYQTGNREVRAAIREYKNGLTKVRAERIDGNYTVKDYEYMNNLSGVNSDKD